MKSNWPFVFVRVCVLFLLGSGVVQMLLAGYWYFVGGGDSWTKELKTDGMINILMAVMISTAIFTEQRLRNLEAKLDSYRKKVTSDSVSSEESKGRTDIDKD